METMGPWAVGFRRARATDARRGGRKLPLAIWYPVAPAEAQGRRAGYSCVPLPLMPLRVRSDTAVWDAPIARARKWPVVIFLHGLPSLETQSPNYTETLASHGFVVVAVRHTGTSVFSIGRDVRRWLSALKKGATPDLPRTLPGEQPPGGLCATAAAARRGEAWALEWAGRPSAFCLSRTFDAWFAMDWVAEQARTPSSFLHGAVDPDRVGLTGHSAGGSICLAAAAGYGGSPPDPRIRAIVPIAPAGTAFVPAEALDTVAAPALFVAAGSDKLAPWAEETRRVFDLIPSRAKAIARIRGAAHTHFADIEGYVHLAKSFGFYPWVWRLVGPAFLSRLYDDTHAPGALPAYESQRLLNKYAVAFLALHLKGDDAGRALLTPGQAGGHEPAVDLLTRPGNTTREAATATAAGGSP